MYACLNVRLFMVGQFWLMMVRVEINHLFKGSGARRGGKWKCTNHWLGEIAKGRCAAMAACSAVPCYLQESFVIRRTSAALSRSFTAAVLFCVIWKVYYRALGQSSARYMQPVKRQSSPESQWGKLLTKQSVVLPQVICTRLLSGNRSRTKQNRQPAAR